MKKTITTILLAVTCGIASFAQTIPNGDFSLSTGGPSTGGIIFSNWNGRGDIGTINGAAATVSAFIKEELSEEEICLEFAEKKCITWGPGPSTFSNVAQYLQQAVSILGIPEKLTGNYIFGSSPSNLYGRIDVTGTFNGKNISGSFKPAQVLQVAPFEINIISIDCEYTKGSKNPCFFNSNEISIIITSCILCPEIANVNDYTTLTVDDLSFTAPIASAIESSELATSNLAYPNPVKDILHVSGKVEIFNIMGTKIVEGENEINVENLPSGIYVVKANGKSQKIVKE